MAQKTISDLNPRSTFDETCKFPVDDGTAETKYVAGAKLTDFFNSRSSNKLIGLIKNAGLSVSVASGAMTVALKQLDGVTDPSTGSQVVTVNFRSASLISSETFTRTITAPLSLVISSGSTLGQFNSVSARLFVYLIDNAGTVEMAISRQYIPEDELVTTSAEGGAGGADSVLPIYSNNIRTNVAIRLIGYFDNTQTTAGTWAATPTKIQMIPFEGHRTNTNTNFLFSISNWNSVTVPDDSYWRGICFGSDRFVGVAFNAGALGSQAMMSFDGRNWTAITGLEANQWQSVCWNGVDKFVAVASNGTHQVMTSPDGITWTNQTAISGTWERIIYANGQYVACGISGTNRVMTSPDGITWTAQTPPSQQWWGIAYGAGLYVCVAITGTNRVMTSPDGITWTLRTVTSDAWRSVVFGNGIFVAVGGSSGIMTSPDGINWTDQVISNSTAIHSVTFANGCFVIVSETTTVPLSGQYPVVIYSEDGITWSKKTSAPAGEYHDVCFGADRFVAVGGNTSGGSTIMTSLVNV